MIRHPSDAIGTREGRNRREAKNLTGRAKCVMAAISSVLQNSIDGNSRKRSGGAGSLSATSHSLATQRLLSL
jgi:hypothetical protein